VTNSPLGKIEEDSTEQYGMEALRANAWLSPAICSPLNDRFYAMLIIGTWGFAGFCRIAYANDHSM